MAKKSTKVTPLMKQYFQVKSKHPDALLLFRVGDFYETFGEDAVQASQALGIVLTSRNNGGSDIELAGFPYHSLELYLPKLVRAGFRVAICEQLEKPSKEKKIVKRGVTEIITPGITQDQNLLDNKSNNFLASLHFLKNQFGISLLDISTGEFYTSEGDQRYIEKILESYKPSEIIYSKTNREVLESWLGDGYYTYALDEWFFDFEYAREKLLKHFKTNSLKGYGIEEYTFGQTCAGVILHYLEVNENKSLNHVLSIKPIISNDYVWLDKFTVRNLELLESLHPTGTSLFEILDFCITPMGSRMLKKWVAMPLLDIEKIELRHKAVEYFHSNQNFSDLQSKLKRIGDLERLCSKIPNGKINPKEIKHLEKSLYTIEELKHILLKTENTQLVILGDILNPCHELTNHLNQTLLEDPAISLNKGNIFKPGVSEELDEYLNLIKNNKKILAELQAKEAKETGIASLKIGYNNVFGYYFEVTNKYKGQNLIPDNWVRKQTLKGSERYISDELKQLEEKILSAEEKIQSISEQLFENLKLHLQDYIEPIILNAQAISQIDCLMAFAQLALKNNYTKPIIHDGFELKIKNGRHPVIEKNLPLGEAYIPNDVFLDIDHQQIIMITGPNMSGKSALLRQTAIICLMAQMGSFVPADEVEMGFLDRVFTRVGASDNLSKGESTFMLEMNESANILNNLSNRSLILLDEIGRGTSTYDGISIAWAIAEYLHENGQFRPKTLFATHYHELNQLSQTYDRIKNYSIDVKESKDRIIFLRKLVEGGSEHSFGIHVAQLAGLPDWIIQRSSDILKEMESKNIDQKEHSNGQPVGQELQLQLFDSETPESRKLKKELKKLNINNISPVEALLKLQELQKLLN